MLLKVKYLNYSAGSYAPCVEEAVINTDHVRSVVPIEAKRSEPCVRVVFVDGAFMDCVGKLEDFLPEERENGRKL